MTALLAAASGFKVPYLDYHALAPEIIVGATLVVVLVADLFIEERHKWVLSNVSGLGLLGALLVVIELGARSQDTR